MREPLRLTLRGGPQLGPEMIGGMVDQTVLENPRGSFTSTSSPLSMSKSFCWQLARMVICAHETLDLGPRVEQQPWLGARPCLPTCCRPSVLRRVTPACGSLSATAATG